MLNNDELQSDYQDTLETTYEEIKKGHKMSMISNLYSIPFHTIMIYYIMLFKETLAHDSSTLDGIEMIIALLFPIILIIIIAQIISIVLSFKAINIYKQNQNDIKDINRRVMNYLNIINIILTVYYIVEVIL